MSVSKWAYIPEVCDGDICVGDCDKCSKAMQIDEIIDELEAIRTVYSDKRFGDARLMRCEIRALKGAEHYLKGAKHD